MAAVRGNQIHNKQIYRTYTENSQLLFECPCDFYLEALKSGMKLKEFPTCYWTVGFRHFSFFSSSFARKCVKSDTRVLMSFQLFVANHAVWTCSLDWRTLPTACEITAHLIRQDPPINGWSHCSAQPFKSRRSRTFSSAPRLRRGKPHFCSRVVPLWHISQKHHWKYDDEFLCVFLCLLSDSTGGWLPRYFVRLFFWLVLWHLVALRVSITWHPVTWKH